MPNSVYVYFHCSLTAGDDVVTLQGRWLPTCEDSFLKTETDETETGEGAFCYFGPSLKNKLPEVC